MSICVPNIQSASILLSNFIQFLLNRVTLQQTLFHFFMVRCFFVSFFFEQPYIFRIGIWSKSGSFLFIHLIKTELFVTSVAVHFACHCVINCLLAEIGNRSTQLKTIIPTFSSGILSTLHVRAFFFVLSLSLPHQMPFQFHADFYQKLNRKDTFKYSQRNLKVAYLHKTELATSQKIGQDNK